MESELNRTEFKQEIFTFRGDCLGATRARSLAGKVSDADEVINQGMDLCDPFLPVLAGSASESCNYSACYWRWSSRLHHQASLSFSLSDSCNYSTCYWRWPSPRHHQASLSFPCQRVVITARATSAGHHHCIIKHSCYSLVREL